MSAQNNDNRLTELDHAGLADIDMRAVLHEVIADIQSAYRHALTGSGLDRLAKEVEATVNDYVANNYGDD